MSERVAHEVVFGVTHLLAAVAAGLAFTLTLRAQFRDAWMMCAAGILALAANAAGAEIFGAQAGVFVATLAVGLAGGLFARRLSRSPLVFIVPGVLMLVPGSAGFDSILQLLANETVSGITAAFDTFVTATSIAYGLMVSAVGLPGRLGAGRLGPVIGRCDCSYEGAPLAALGVVGFLLGSCGGEEPPDDGDGG